MCGNQTKALYVVRDLDFNLITFQFLFAADHDLILSEGAWAFEGCILLLKQMTGLEVPSEVEFSMARFWVKAYNVPGQKQTVSFARLLAPNIDVFVSCSKATMFGVDKALCFRVDIDILKPLRLVVYIKVADK